jgi:hypothetical protein
VVDYQWEFGDFRYLNAAYGEALPLKYISPIFPNDNIAIKVTSANVKPTWVFAGTAYQYENTILGESLTNETRLTLGRIHLILNILQPYKITINLPRWFISAEIFVWHAPTPLLETEIDLKKINNELDILLRDIDII